ncbi:ribbon-helix-helix domain-containing protein [Terriglobus tenax]|uniref:ribbon-helix-helix domain-containing protein n=1 Tax=Terriglobus tenax TaxID=1111115 RepID=UPI0021DFB033|nr:hypothetical protein [Terriglobus tenax]
MRTLTAAKRNGKPYTLYLSDELSSALASASERRKIDKSVIVRIAIEKLLNELESGQLQLPLGIQ